jgi:cytochrome oxidase Cu insertion factor (SCO1/SenC/PrrC family)
MSAERPPSKKWWTRAPFWLVAAALALSIPAALLTRHRQAVDPLPKLGQLAPFALVRESGAPLSSADLTGKVWVADFVFLGCSQSCPLLTTRMGHLANFLAEEGKKRGRALPVRLVSFTIDPTNDTPSRLSDYAVHWHADPAIWAFATGAIGDVQHVVADGFKVAFGRVDDGAGAFEMMHGNYFVVVDPSMQIRGYYSTDLPEEMNALTRDVVALASRVSAGNGAPSFPAALAKGDPP